MSEHLDSWNKNISFVLDWSMVVKQKKLSGTEGILRNNFSQMECFKGETSTLSDAHISEVWINE